MSGISLSANTPFPPPRGDARVLHSLPGYYGYNAAMCIAVPSLLILVLWLLIQPMLVQNAVIGLIPDQMITEGSSVGLVMSDVRRVAEGLNTAVAQGALTRTEAVDLLVDQTDVRALLADVGVALGSDVQAPVLQAAQKYRALTATGAATMVVVVIAIAVLGFALAFRMTHPAFRARNTVEAGVKALLMIAASLAILTTVGIV